MLFQYTLLLLILLAFMPRILSPDLVPARILKLVFKKIAPSGRGVTSYIWD